MKTFCTALQSIVLFLLCWPLAAAPGAGFVLPDSVRELQLKIRTLNDLIILPVTINGNIRVNLILDTGCRNLVLFGKQFRKLLPSGEEREVKFSGLGSGMAVSGHLSLNNEVSIESITGHNVPVVVVSQRNLFAPYRDIHGIIGYDIFMKFEIEINSGQQTISFRPALDAVAPPGYVQVPLTIVESRPVMQSNIHFTRSREEACELMIDTGSSLGLLLKRKDMHRFSNYYDETVIGRGLSGLLSGYKGRVRKLNFNGFEMTSLPIGIVESEMGNNASIGMNILKDYIVILNYCKAYACFRPNA